MSSYTIEEVIANFAEARKMFLPAVMKDTPDNGNLLSAYLHRNNLEPTPQNFYRAANDLVGIIEWSVKPAKLIAVEENNRQRNQSDVMKGIRTFADNVKKGEVKAAYEKEQETYEKSSLSLIAGYTPISKRGQIDFAKQTELQNHLKKYLAQQKSKGASMKAAHAAIANELQRQYTLAEKSVERV